VVFARRITAVDAHACGEPGRVIVDGVTDVPGLYFLGLAWQYTRGSALLGWVKDDAEFIAAKIEAGARRQVAVPSNHRQPADTRALRNWGTRERESDS